MSKFYIISLLCLAINASAQWQPTNSAASDNSTIYHLGGNVGIGTSSPGGNLHINSTSPIGLRIQNITGGVGNKAGIDFSTTSGTSKVARIDAIDQGSFNGDLAFYTDGDNTENGNVTERMRITKSGFVGIGVSAPAYSLDLKTAASMDGINIQNSTRFARLFSPSLVVGGYNYITKVNDSGFVFGGNSVNSTDFGFVIAPWTNAYSGLRVGSTGNVTVGKKLILGQDIFANSSPNGITLGGDQASLEFVSSTYAEGFGARFYTATEGSGLTSLRLAVRGNTPTWTDAMHIKVTGGVEAYRNGFIGIGTNNPDQLLTVNGTIHSKEVKVDLNIIGPDYVFEKDYALPSLESVKTYIDQNKHLPEVPSAKEMEANGINLSEMNMLLLKKVEELTLYVIELKKEMADQREEIKVLKNVNPKD